MTKRRSRGDGGLHWSESRQRWVVELVVGHSPTGRRIIKRRIAKSKTQARNVLKKLVDEYGDDNADISTQKYTVENAVNDWLANFERLGREGNTLRTAKVLIDNHIIPDIGRLELKKLSAEDVDRLLSRKSATMVTSTLRLMLSILRRAIRRAQARDRVKRNVAMLCDCPAGRGKGRPSKALTFVQAEAVLLAAEADDSTTGEYIIVSLLSGARTEEARPLTWPDVDRTGDPDATPPIPPHINVVRSVRAGGDTKTRKSRRAVALAQRGVDALDRQKARQTHQREQAGKRWIDTGIVFASKIGTELDSANIRRSFRRIIQAAGLNPTDWIPRELRHSFVSLLSDSGVPLEQISRLVGHSGTAVTELVYRKQIRPVIEQGAITMDELFKQTGLRQAIRVAPLITPRRADTPAPRSKNGHKSGS